MKFISIDEAVASCSSLIKNITREERLLVTFWVWMAEKQIGHNKANIATDEIDVYNLSVLKPDNHLKTKDIALIHNDGSDLTYTYRGYDKRIHPRSASNNPSNIDVYEDRYNIFLGSNGSVVDRIKISYWAYPLDDEGNPLIPEEHLYAIMRFVSFMIAERNGEAESKIIRLTQEWKIQASKARAKNQMPDIPEARQIMKSWMSLIPKMSDLEYNLY